MPEQSLLSILPNLGIGVVSILALVYVTKEFIKQLKEERVMARDELKEAAIAHRGLEKEVRESIMGQLSENTLAMKEFLRHYDKKR